MPLSELRQYRCLLQASVRLSRRCRGPTTPTSFTSDLRGPASIVAVAAALVDAPDESGGATGDVAGDAEHRGRASGCRLADRQYRIGAGRTARARGRADRINHRTGGARQAGTPGRARLAALGSERCADAVTAGQPCVRSGTQRGTVVRPGWLRRAFTLGEASDAFGFELRKLRLDGGAQADPLLTAAAIDGVQPRETIRVGRTGSIEHGCGLASDWAAEATPGAAAASVRSDSRAAARDRERRQQAEHDRRSLAGRHGVINAAEAVPQSMREIAPPTGRVPGLTATEN